MASSLWRDAKIRPKPLGIIKYPNEKVRNVEHPLLCEANIIIWGSYGETATRKKFRNIFHNFAKCCPGGSWRGKADEIRVKNGLFLLRGCFSLLLLPHSVSCVSLSSPATSLTVGGIAVPLFLLLPRCHNWELGIFQLLFARGQTMSFFSL